MTSFVQLFVIATVIAAVCGESFPVTSSSQDYFLLLQGEFRFEVETADLEVAAVNTRYADRVDVIQWQQQHLLNAIVQTNKTLLPMQAISYFWKECIQKYNSHFVTYQSAKDQMKRCSDKAAVVSTTLTSTAQALVNTARYEVDSVFAVNVALCEGTYAKNVTALQLCYIKYADSTTYRMNYYLTTARSHLQKALYDSADASRTAIECLFTVEKDTLETIGRTIMTIAECEAPMNQPRGLAVLNGAEPSILQSLITGNFTEQ